MINRFILALAFSVFSLVGVAQEAPFDVVLEPMSISELGGLQSYAFGQHDGKWLLVGGRLDGLHRRQPWASFDLAGHNNQLIVVDPNSQEKWTAPLSSLPAALQEQLSSTNMNYIQNGDYLYCLGGYGYSAIEGDHITFSNLSAINVPEVINAIMNGSEFSEYFRQLSDPQFQVTGGSLKKIYNVYYLMGGHKFMGRYNPMNNPTFTQEYTNQIRRFTLTDNGTEITIDHLEPYTDAANLHRRDYNADHQILPDGEEGITMFSGVFQVADDLPFLNSVTISQDGYNVNNSFQQYYNHYHCASIPLYSMNNNEMHTVFFGGIAQYYDDNGTLVQDDNVPFVNTIARVTREADGTMGEYKLPIVMPSLLGTGAEFIPINNIPQFNNGVLDLDQISSDTTLIGHIFGGISSTDANIFWINNGTQSAATNQIFKVYLIKNNTLSTHELNEQSRGSLNLRVYPNPNDGIFTVSYFLINGGAVRLSLSDINGKIIEEIILQNQDPGENSYTYDLKSSQKRGAYFFSVQTESETAKQKIIVRE